MQILHSYINFVLSSFWAVSRHSSTIGVSESSAKGMKPRRWNTKDEIIKDEILMDEIKWDQIQ